MKYQRALILGLLVLLCGCERTLKDRKLGDNFRAVFLRAGDVVPAGADLQVRLDGMISPVQYPGVTTSLQVVGGAVLAGTQSIRDDLDLLIFIPQDPLPPGKNFILSIDTAEGDHFEIPFSTGAGSGGTPPAVTISAPAAGANVSGVIEVTASATDDIGLAGNIRAAADSVQFAWLPAAATARFFLNTVALTDGAHTLSVTATDSDAQDGATAITLNVSNPSPNSVPFPVFDAGLESITGVIPASTLAAAMPAGSLLQVYSLTDANYTGWNDFGLKVGVFQGATYAPDADFNSPGVACLCFLNYATVDFNLPATTLTLVYPDHSQLVVTLPAVTLAGWDIGNTDPQQAIFYVSADGHVHWGHTANASVSTSESPDRSPSVALALPSP